MRIIKLGVLFISLLTSFTIMAQGKDSTYVLSATSFYENGNLLLPDMTEWRFKEGNDSLWASPDYDHSSWQKLDSAAISNIDVDENGLFEAWFTIRIKLDSSFTKIPLYLNQNNSAATDVYLDGELFHSFGNTNYLDGEFLGFRRRVDRRPKIALPINQEVFIAVHFVELHGVLYQSPGRVLGQASLLRLIKEVSYLRTLDYFRADQNISIIDTSVLGLIAGLFWLITLLNRGQPHLLYSALTISFFWCSGIIYYLSGFLTVTSSLAYLLSKVGFPFAAASIVCLVLLIASILEVQLKLFLKLYLGLVIVLAIASGFVPAIFDFMNLALYSMGLLCIYYFISRRAKLKGSKVVIVIGFTLFLLTLVISVLLTSTLSISLDRSSFFGYFPTFLLPITLLIYLALWLREMVQDVQKKAKKLIQVSEEKKALLENQNIELERQVTKRTSELNQSLEDLKATQSQLIQSEKMASLGELTAGIAHEIQNPLNFVNNFSEVSEELVAELKEELEKGEVEEAKEISNDVIENLKKINHHGQRASGIVNGMLQHSRTGTGEKETTDINALADEYLRLAYHGMRAKDKSFNADFKTEFDESLPKVNVVPQDIGRVLLNLINNAFYAVSEKAARHSDPELSDGEVSVNYQPEVIVSTRKLDNQIEISVCDNGEGIPEEVQDKIFQPFFTTKPTGQGTGLGLSLSYDIVKAHGGEITIESELGNGSEFTVNLPQ